MAGNMANDSPISERELEILRLVAKGASNQQIAQQLSISINTVKVHLRNIFSKIGVVSRTEATIYAINNGLVAVASGASHAPIGRAIAAEIDRDDFLGDPATIAAEEPASIAAPPDVAPLPRPAHPQARRIIVGVAAGVLLLIAGAFGLQVAGRTAAPAATQAPATAAPAASTENQRWLSHSPMPRPRDGFALTSYDQEHKLYVIGGLSAGVPSAAIDRFDPATNVWVSLNDKPVAVSNVGAVTLRGNIYVPGGEDRAGAVRDILEIYNPREQRWSQGAALPAPRSRYALVVWEGQLYLIGGWDGSQIRSEVYLYDPQSDRWAAGPAIAVPRQNAGATVAAGRIYLIGGSDASGPLRENARLDPAANNARWEGIAPLPVPVAAPGVVAPAGTLLVFDPDQRQGMEYDQDSDAWTSFVIPEGATVSANNTLLGTSIYFVAGATSPTAGLVEEYRVFFTVFLPGPGRSAPSP